MSSSVGPVGMILPNIWKNKIHVQNHQPVIGLIYARYLQSMGSCCMAIDRHLRFPSAWNKLATKPFRLLSAWIDIGGDQNSYPLVMFKIAIENGPFIVDFPMKNGGSFHS